MSQPGWLGALPVDCEVLGVIGDDSGRALECQAPQTRPPAAARLLNHDQLKGNTHGVMLQSGDFPDFLKHGFSQTPFSNPLSTDHGRAGELRSGAASSARA